MSKKKITLSNIEKYQNRYNFIFNCACIFTILTILFSITFKDITTVALICIAITYIYFKKIENLNRKEISLFLEEKK